MYRLSILSLLLACTPSNDGQISKRPDWTLQMEQAVHNETSIVGSPPSPSETVPKPKREPILTIEQFDALVLALKSCDARDVRMRRCAQVSELNARLRHPAIGLKARRVLKTSVGRKRLSHPAPAVRLYAVQILSGYLSDQSPLTDLVVARFKLEKDVNVLLAMMNALAGLASNNTVLAETLSQHQRHPSPEIRSASIRHRLRLDIDGELSFSALFSLLVATETSARVIRTVCEEMLRYDPERALKFIRTEFVQTDHRHLNSCMEPLIFASVAPTPKSHHDGALEMVTAYIAQKVLLKKPIPWQLLQILLQASVFVGKNPKVQVRYDSLTKELLAALRALPIDISTKSLVLQNLHAYGFPLFELKKLLETLNENDEESVRLDETIILMERNHVDKETISTP